MSQTTQSVEGEDLFASREWYEATKHLYAHLYDECQSLRRGVNQLQDQGRNREALDLRATADRLLAEAERVEDDLRRLARCDPEVVRCLLDPDDYTFGVAYPDPDYWCPDPSE